MGPTFYNTKFDHDWSSSLGVDGQTSDGQMDRQIETHTLKRVVDGGEIGGRGLILIFY